MSKATKADQYLLDQIRQGRQQAWSDFVARYRGRLLSFARSRLAQRADAEDVVQETFISFVRSLDRFRGDCDIETYLFALLRRKIIDTYRSRQSSHTCLIQDTHASDYEKPSDAFSAVAGSAQTASWYARADEQNTIEKQALADALNDLVRALRESLNFRDLEITELLFYCQLANKDIARTLSVRENLIAVVKHRSLKQIREFIERKKLPARDPDAPFEQLLTEVWESQRPSCPKRSTIGSFTLGTLDPQWRDYVDFHLNTLGCRFCRANLEDIQTAAAEKGADKLYNRIMESTVGFLSHPG